jgi:hypothetical protein
MYVYHRQLLISAYGVTQALKAIVSGAIMSPTACSMINVPISSQVGSDVSVEDEQRRHICRRGCLWLVGQASDGTVVASRSSLIVMITI